MRRAALLALVLSVVGCGSSSDGESSFSVVYRVTGSAASVDVTFESEGGGTSQLSDEAIPWSYTFEAARGDFLYVSAQNQGETGSVTASVRVNGQTIDSATSEGAFVIATASGTAGDG